MKNIFFLLNFIFFSSAYGQPGWKATTAKDREDGELRRQQLEKSVPESFNSTPETALSPLKALSEHLDYADQIVTGRTHVIDEAHRFASFKTEKEDKKIQFANTPKTDTRSPVKKFVDWLHH